MWDHGSSWAIVGLFSGFWKLALVAAVTLILYGRSGLRLPHHPIFRLLRPWSSAPRKATAPASRLGDRWFLLLLVTAATAVAAWIITRMTVIGQASASP